MAQRIPRIAQLDPLRALAAFLVILQHYLPGFEIGHMPFGWIGVDLFFVISGYLITAILLKQKEAHIDRLRIIKGFVIKRALRLFPAYYALILFFVVMRATTGLWSWDPGQGIYYFTYTSNFLFFQEGFLSGHLNHLWSLAVEEQFYLVWPWFVLFVPRPWLSRLILLGLVFALVCKSTWEWEHIRMLPTSHFDTLGGGALLAIHGTSASRIVQFLQRQAGWVALLGLAGMIMCNLEIGTWALLAVSVLVFSVSVVAGCIRGFTGWFGWVLDRPILAHLGGISYGLYLYHLMMPFFIRLATQRLGWEVDPYVQLTLGVGATIAVSELSFRFIERPFLRWKARFDL